MYLLILPFYAASGGEYNPKRFNLYTNVAKCLFRWFAPNLWKVPDNAVFKLPSMVFTQLKAAVLLLSLLFPTIIAVWEQPRSFTAVKQCRPSETTAVPGSKLLIDHFASSLLLNLDTTFNFIREGFSSLFSTAATKGVLFSEPRPRLPFALPPQYASSISTFPDNGFDCSLS